MSNNNLKLEIKNVGLSLGDEEVIKNLSLSVFENEVVSMNRLEKQLLQLTLF